MITGCVRRVPRSLRQEDTHRAVGRPERRLRYPPRAAAGQADGADEGMGGRGAPQVGRRRGQRRRRPPFWGLVHGELEAGGQEGPRGRRDRLNEYLVTATDNIMGKQTHPAEGTYQRGSIVGAVVHTNLIVRAVFFT